MFKLSQEFLFDAAHSFPDMPDGHKYEALHGHSFRVTVTIIGSEQNGNGFVTDFDVLEQACGKVRATLDHKYLNEVPGLQRPSLENIARWIWDRLGGQFPGLSDVTVARDSCRHACSYSGPS
ncbi:MAG: 6-carboxytetrahydropterin synthase QueD [Burkholderiales bacterium]